MSNPISARSDQIEVFRDFLKTSPLLPFLSTLASVSLVVDANVVYRAVLWMAKTRKNPDAEPEFIELAKTGLVTYHAPKFLIQEIRKYLPEIAQKADKPITEIEELWNQVDEG